MECVHWKVVALKRMSMMGRTEKRNLFERLLIAANMDLDMVFR